MMMMMMATMLMMMVMMSMMMLTLLTGEVTRDGGRLGGLDGGRDPAEGVPAREHFQNIYPIYLQNMCSISKYVFVREILEDLPGFPTVSPVELCCCYSYSWGVGPV